MALVVADTDVLIDALHGRDPVADRIAIGLETGTLATTAVTLFELMSGARSARAHDAVRDLLGALPILPLEEGASRRAAEVRLHLETAGRPLGMADYLIAGICLDRSATLLTRDVAHFGRVPGLRLDPLFAD